METLITALLYIGAAGVIGLVIWGWCLFCWRHPILGLLLALFLGE